MAIFHLSAKVISRASGRSSVAAAAYRTAERLHDDRQGLEHDYSRKGGVVHAEILAPANAPDWMRHRDQLWNAVEAAEKRRDAQLAREIEVALPRELDRDDRLTLLRGFAQREFVARGMIADVAIHEGTARDGQGQPHAHIMLTMRELTGEGFGQKNRGWNAPDLLIGWREAWAHDANTALERAGSLERIDHRSLDVQRAEAEQLAERARDNRQANLALQHERKVIELSREPEPKIGPTANAMEKRGIVTERGDEFRAAQARNAQREGLGQRQLALRLEIAERARAAVAFACERLQELWSRAEAALSRAMDRWVNDLGEQRANNDPTMSQSHAPSPVTQAADKNQVHDANEEHEWDRRDSILGRHWETTKQVKKPDRDRER